MSTTRLRRIVLPAVGALALFVGLVVPGGASASAATVAPHGTPYMVYSANISENGSGTGYSSYINVHDAHNNAFAVGIQSDKGSATSKGNPRYIWERVQNGKFTYGYLGAASHNLTPVQMRWYQNDVATFLVNGHTIAAVSMKLQGRFFFNAEGNARLNGDVVHSSIRDVKITVGAHPGQIGLAGTWNTGFSFHGLKARQFNSAKNQGASFWIDGRVTGLPKGGNWDTTEVAGIAMIAQAY
ncbi:hypothetical protein EDF24_2254 [Curtobacterium sp. PhB130]|uniref:hypothetical protein n=1 Tax=unclassified Curtobacterium TaxID=257496 RepID=UPI000F4B87B1|nr:MULTISPECIES: hypothetical protein [unclassified Curtobacterium]ROP64518.1 hypothetical protein EDF55_1164 [Curtobacterium sp. ZW137]ROS74819.1 hypothetical protein EDF24_2254 [Curtobacterium sp. PhB130]TCK63433.1 hypothetical protein EDF27_1974 [Curtobacterium sp. PhB136]